MKGHINSHSPEFRRLFACRLALSLCPAVAVTTTVANGFVLGVAVLAVQVLSSVTVALARRFIHPRVRIPVYTIIIAVWVSAIDMTLAAFVPALYAQVGLYVKLIVAFAIIISRLEVFASKYPLIPSFWDGFGMGLGFLFALVVIGAFRELLGSGAILGIPLTPGKPLLFFALPAGGFFSIALLMAMFAWVEKKVMGTSGGTSVTAMVACCLHHVTDVLPVLGLSAAATFLARYQRPFMLVGLGLNLIGIIVMLIVLYREYQKIQPLQKLLPALETE